MAIKHTELRPGNYHKTAGLEIPRMDVSSVKIDGQAFSAITAYGIYLIQDGKLEFEPIPLTEEWLERFGFNSKYKSVHTHWNLYAFGLDQKSNEDDDHNIIPQEQVFYFDHHWDIKWVHQLQNLYFALTETELVSKSVGKKKFKCSLSKHGTTL